MSRIRSRWLPLAALLAVVVAWVPVSAGAEGNDCFVMGGDIVIDEGQDKNCDVLVVRGDVRVRDGGAVNGNIAVVGGDALIGGAVSEDVWASGSVVLEETAFVEGNVAALESVDVAQGAIVRGEIRSDLTEFGEPADGASSEAESDSGSNLGDAARLALVAALGLSLVVLAALFAGLTTAVAPDAIGRVRDALGASPGRSFWLGLGIQVLLPFAMLVLLPLFPVLLVLLLGLLVMFAIGAVGLSERLGGRILPGSSRPIKAATGAGAVSLLMAVLVALAPTLGDGWLLLPLAGLLHIVVASFALGAGLLTVFGTRHWPRMDEPPASGVPVPLPGQEPEGAGGTEEAGTVAPALAAGAAAELTDDGDDDAPAAAEAALVPAADAGDVDGVVADVPDQSTDIAETAPAVAELLDEPVAGDEASAQGDESTPGWGPFEQAPERDAPIATDDGGAAGGGDGSAAPEADERTPLAEAEPGVEAGGDAPAIPTVKDVPGISPIMAHLLTAAGIGTAADLASADASDVVDAVAASGVTTIERDTAEEWIQAARGFAGA